MNNYTRGGGGGSQKTFKADELKGFLMARSVALSYSKDLCVAGKIKLEQIPDYTDRMTLIQYGQLEVDPRVDKEVMRIATRVKKRIEADKVGVKEKVAPAASEEPDEAQGANICSTCLYGPNESGECPVLPGAEDGMKECPEFEEANNKDEADLSAIAANERLREQEEAERSAEEDAASEANQTKPETSLGTIYKCSSCVKQYKTMKGLEKHSKKEHPLLTGEDG